MRGKPRRVEATMISVGKKQWNDKLGGYAKHGNSNGGRTM